MMRRLLLAALLALLPAIGQAQSTCTTASTCTPIVKMDCGSGGSAYPTCGAGYGPGSIDTYRDVAWSRSYVTGVGPAGQDAYRITFIPHADETLEFYVMGLEWGVPAVSQGQCRYFRELIRFGAGLDWSSDDGGRFGNKHWMWGSDGTGASSRGIFNVRSNLVAPGLPDGNHDATRAMFRTQLNVGGEKIDNYDLVHSTWYYVQTEMCTSSTSSATDGSIKIWVNTNTYGSPSSQSTSGFAWDAVELDEVRLGYYSQTLGIGKSASYDIVYFEYDDQFSTDWNGSGGAATPTKYRLRFR